MSPNGNYLAHVLAMLNMFRINCSYNLIQFLLADSFLRDFLLAVTSVIALNRRVLHFLLSMMLSELITFVFLKASD